MEKADFQELITKRKQLALYINHQLNEQYDDELFENPWLEIDTQEPSLKEKQALTQTIETVEELIKDKNLSSQDTLEHIMKHELQMVICVNPYDMLAHLCETESISSVVLTRELEMAGGSVIDLLENNSDITHGKIIHFDNGIWLKISQ